MRGGARVAGERLDAAQADCILGDPQPAQEIERGAATALQVE
jgi:hypothetical protein